MSEKKKCRGCVHAPAGCLSSVFEDFSDEQSIEILEEQIKTGEERIMAKKRKLEECKEQALIIKAEKVYFENIVPMFPEIDAIVSFVKSKIANHKSQHPASLPQFIVDDSEVPVELQGFDKWNCAIIHLATEGIVLNMNTDNYTHKVCYDKVYYQYWMRRLDTSFHL